MSKKIGGKLMVRGVQGSQFAVNLSGRGNVCSSSQIYMNSILSCDDIWKLWEVLG